VWVGSHVSAPLQTVLSTHCESWVQQPGIPWWTQPPAPKLAVGSQLPTVHGAVSLQSGGVPGLHSPVVRLQVSTPSQNWPLSQWSRWLQAWWAASQLSVVQGIPSSQSGSVLQQPGILGKEQSPVLGSQVSLVQTSSSRQTTSGGFVHSPVERIQVSTPLQASPSSHCAFDVQQLTLPTCTHAPNVPSPLSIVSSQLSSVHTLPSSQL